MVGILILVLEVIGFSIIARVVRDKDGEIWLVAALLAIWTVVWTAVAIVVVSDRHPIYFAHDTLQTAIVNPGNWLFSAVVGVVWWITRRAPRLLGRTRPAHPLWVLLVPLSGVLGAVVCRAIGFHGDFTALVLPPLQLVVVLVLRAQTANSRVDTNALLPQEPEHQQIAVNVGSTAPAKKILLSYRREDSGDVTGRIYDRLVQQFGKQQVFKDVDSIPLGVDFRKHLHEIVGSCDVVVAVIGDRWNGAVGQGVKRRLEDAKDYVRIELEAALQRDIPVIPVLVRGSQIPDESELPASLTALAYRNGLPVRPDPDFHRDMDRLIEGIVARFGAQSGS